MHFGGMRVIFRWKRIIETRTSGLFLLYIFNQKLNFYKPFFMIESNNHPPEGRVPLREMKDLTAYWAKYLNGMQQVLDEVLFMRLGKVILHTSAAAIREEQGKSVDAYFREVFAC